MGATTVTGTILGVDNDPIVGAYITFRLKSVGTDSVATSTIDQDSISIITDASGQFTQVLWDNGDSGIESIMEIKMPSGQRVDVIIPAGDAAIDIWDLIENYQVGTADPQLPTNEALFMRKANDLSDVADVPTARSNLGLGTAALTASTDYATAAQGTTADAALPKTGGAMTGAITTNSTFDGRDVATDGTKLDGIEPLADVTDEDSILAAGAYIVGGTDVAIADGGTGASTEATARTNLEFQTNVTGPVTEVTVTSYTVLITDHTLTVDVDAIGGNVTINLEAVAVVGNGFELTVKKTGSTYSVTIDADGTETIDGELTQVVTGEDSVIGIVSNDTGWDIIQGQGTGIGDAIGTTIQAHDDALDDIAALTPSQYDVMEYDGANWVAKDGRIVENICVVRSASDLSGTLTPGKVYVVDGEVDMGTQEIAVPSGGIEIRGIGVAVAKLFSSEDNYTLFNNSTDSGSVTIEDIELEVSGASSQLFDLKGDTGNEIFRLMTVNYENCTNLGEVDGFAAALFSTIIMLNCDDGLTFSGTWAQGIRVDGFIARLLGATATVFDEGTSLTFGSRFISNANMNLASGSTAYGFAEANFDNDGGFELIAGEYTGAGEVVDTAKIDQVSVKSRFRDNNFSDGSGVDNTYIGSRWKVTTETTTPATIGTQVKLLGTTTYSDEEWFSDTTDNAFVYDSTLQSKMIIQGVISIASGNNNQIVLLVRHWDDSASAYVDVWESPYLTTNGSGRGENKAVLAFVDINENDRIELWARNDTDNDDMTMLENSELAIMERAN